MPEMPGEATRESVKGPWGPWATVGFTCLIAAVSVMVQIALAIVYLIVRAGRSPTTNMSEAAAGLGADGFFGSMATVLSGSAALGVTILIVRLRKGPSLREYLAMRPVSLPTLLRWLLYTAIFVAASDGLSYLAGYPIVPDWMLDVYRSAGFLPLLVFALMVAAPISEEVVFRGFLFEGLRHSRLGDVGAMVVASLAWTSLHTQYEWFYVGLVFASGLFLGAARLLTRSLVIPIVLHAISNGIATLEVARQLWK